MSTPNTPNQNDGSSSNAELMAVMRELIDCINRQTAMDAARSATQYPAPPPMQPSEQQPVAPSAHPAGSSADAVALQYGHSAARWNEAMGQITADKHLQHLNQTADRWQLMIQQLSGMTR